MAGGRRKSSSRMRARTGASPAAATTAAASAAETARTASLRPKGSAAVQKFVETQARELLAPFSIHESERGKRLAAALVERGIPASALQHVQASVNSMMLKELGPALGRAAQRELVAQVVEVEDEAAVAAREVVSREGREALRRRDVDTFPAVWEGADGEQQDAYAALLARVRARSEAVRAKREATAYLKELLGVVGDVDVAALPHCLASGKSVLVKELHATEKLVAALAAKLRKHKKVLRTVRARVAREEKKRSDAAAAQAAARRKRRAAAATSDDEGAGEGAPQADALGALLRDYLQAKRARLQ